MQFQSNKYIFKDAALDPTFGKKNQSMNYSEQMYKVVEDFQRSGKIQKENSQAAGIGKLN